MEDLWSFNEESVARAVHQSAIPVVTGIGHETDFTIADFCADVRCQTPTAAAQMVTVDPDGYRQQMTYLSSRLRRSLTYRFSEYASRLTHAADVLSSFDKAFSRHSFTVDNLFSRMCGAMALGIEKHCSRSAELESRLHRLSPDNAVRLYRSRLQLVSTTFLDRTTRFIASKTNRLNRCVDRLDTLSPLKTLARGYSVVSRKDEREQSKAIITDIDQLEIDEEIEIRLHRGELDCQVVRKRL